MWFWLRSLGLSWTPEVHRMPKMFSKTFLPCLGQNCHVPMSAWILSSSQFFINISFSGLHVINLCKSNNPQPPHCHLGPPTSSHAEFYPFSAPLSMLKHPIYLSSLECWSVLHPSSFTFIYFSHLPIRPGTAWNLFYLLPLKFHSCVLLVHCLNI